MLSQENGCLWQYCNLEGLAWLSPDRIVVVSDRAKRGSQEKRCRKHDQSIHVFGTGRA